jgi:histone H3/H4
MANFVVVSKVKELVSSKDMNSSSDLAEGLDKLVAENLARAIARCKANGRKTVSAKDL